MESIFAKNIKDDSIHNSIHFLKKNFEVLYSGLKNMFQIRTKDLHQELICF